MNVENKNTILIIALDKDGEEIKGSEISVPSEQWANMVRMKDLRWKKVKINKAKEDERIDD